jgi:hypothetical protein
MTVKNWVILSFILGIVLLVLGTEMDEADYSVSIIRGNGLIAGGGVLMGVGIVLYVLVHQKIINWNTFIKW